MLLPCNIPKSVKKVMWEGGIIRQSIPSDYKVLAMHSLRANLLCPGKRALRISIFVQDFVTQHDRMEVRVRSLDGRSKEARRRRRKKRQGHQTQHIYRFASKVFWPWASRSLPFAKIIPSKAMGSMRQKETVVQLSTSRPSSRPTSFFHCGEIMHSSGKNSLGSIYDSECISKAKISSLLQAIFCIRVIKNLQSVGLSSFE